MKKIFGLFLLLSSVFTGVSAQQQMVLEGTYQGQNLYVQNPFARSNQPANLLKYKGNCKNITVF